jgi:hypothetical protein
MTDQEYLDAFETCRIPSGKFRHRDHLRLALLYLQRYGPSAAAIRIAESIRRYATHHGKSDKYNETVTQAWLHLVHAARGDTPGATLDQLLATHSELLDKNALERYYSRNLLNSETARLTFVQPDRSPLPSAALAER